MYQLQKSSRLDNNEMTRLLLRTLVGTCLVSLCYGTALFAIAWRDVQNGVHVVLESTQRSIAGCLNGGAWERPEQALGQAACHGLRSIPRKTGAHPWS